MASLVVWGVAGSGKTTVARGVARELGADFVDADDLHPAANVSKMARGVALGDDDRAPWLRRCAERLAQGRVVLACSALKAKYRRTLRDGAGNVVFVQLSVSRATAQRRVGARPGHFMPPELVASQFDALEVEAGDVAVDAEGERELVLARALLAVQRLDTAGAAQARPP